MSSRDITCHLHEGPALAGGVGEEGQTVMANVQVIDVDSVKTLNVQGSDNLDLRYNTESMICR